MALLNKYLILILFIGFINSTNAMPFVVDNVVKDICDVGDCLIMDNSIAMNSVVEDSCTSIDDCTVIKYCDDVEQGQSCVIRPDYGGIKNTYIVNSCQVTIYNDGPIRMVDINTSKPCDAPAPEDHDFGSIENKVYNENNCEIKETLYKDGFSIGVKDCS